MHRVSARAAHCAATIALAASFLLTSAAAAHHRVDIIWSATTGSGTTGGTTIVAANGDILTADILLTADAAEGGLQGYAISLRFDPLLGNELDLVSAVGFVPPIAGWVASGSNPSSTLDSTVTNVGEVNTFAADTGSAPFMTSQQLIGQVQFSVNNGVDDGIDVFSGLFSAGDGLVVAGGGPGDGVFNGASVIPVASEIPTLSQWGVLSMGMLLLTAIALAVYRRRPISGT